MLPKDADSSTVQIKPHLSKEVYDAPIKKGEIMGTADIVYAGETLGTVNLLAAESRDANYVLVAMRWLERAVKSLTFKIVLAVIVLVIIGFVIAVLIMNRKSKKRHNRRGYKGFSKH